MSHGLLKIMFLQCLHGMFYRCLLSPFVMPSLLILIFCQEDLAVGESQVLRSPTTIFLVLIYDFSRNRIYFLKFSVTVFGTQVWCIKLPSLITCFGLKSISLSGIRIFACLLGPFAWTLDPGPMQE